MEAGVRFGGYRFDVATGRLWSGTPEVRLTPKAGAVLTVLLTHARQPVIKDDLFASVWNDTVVSDDALTSCIQELRRALEDDSSAIAVLPFADMSPGRDQDYFCAGLAEELINALTHVDGLRVASRTASFQFREAAQT